MKVKNLPQGTDTSLGDELIASLTEGMAILRGEVAPSRFHPGRLDVDVRAIRARSGLSQPKFAERFGFPVSTVREWEQGRRQPEAAARVLLLVIDRHPEIVAEVLAEVA